MIHVNHKYLGKVDHLSTNPRSTYREYVTTFWWKSFPENDLPKIGSSLWFQRVMFEAFALSLSLSFPYTHHDFELMFTAFWDFDVQLTPMLLKTRWTANHTPRFLQQKKAWIWYQPWPKTLSSTMGWFLDMKKPRKQYGKRMKKVHMVGQVHGCC